MGAAMVYYLISFPLDDLGYFTPSENVDAMTNILIFSLAGIFTGIVFGVTFLSVARTLTKRKRSKKSYDNGRLWIPSLLYRWLCYGFTGSLSTVRISYLVSFIGLSCYLIYSGLYSSAVTVSQDVALRNSIRKSVTEQSKLLDSIGTAQMEQELESRVLTISKKVSDKMEEETGVETSMTARGYERANRNGQERVSQVSLDLTQPRSIVKYIKIYYC